MKVFVAGSSGAMGRRLVPRLVADGYEVVVMIRDEGKAPWLRGIGARPVVADALDGAAVDRAVRASEPEIVIHQLTALAGVQSFKNFDKEFALTNRLRTEGTDALLDAAEEAGVRRFVAQSFASYRYAQEGGPVKTEDDPLDPHPPAMARETNAAMNHLDKAVTDAGGIALRYGGFYGAANDGLIKPVRKRQFPVIGEGSGISSFVHLDDAAAATVLAVEGDQTGIYNIADDEPAPMSEWLPALAKALGAKPPRHVPTWLAGVIAGKGMVMMAAGSRGASNAKAKRELGWTLRYPSWRQGFTAAYSQPNSVSAGV